MQIFIFLLIIACTACAKLSSDDNHNFIVRNDFKQRRYKPNWDDLDTRPLPGWYDRAKIGIFLHWGVFSVPSFGSEWFWNYWHGSKSPYVEFMKSNYRPGFTYQDFASMFTAEFFNPDSWVKLFKKAGARYVVLTTKHHEGFTLFPSKQTFSWNAVDVGPKKDLVGELSKAAKKAGLKFGAYYSLFEWYNPIFLEDSKMDYKTREYATHKAIPDLKQLINDYKPSLIWSDGDVGPVSYWNSTDFLAWLYNDSPVKDEIVVNDRWGNGTSCKHGDFYNCADRYHPGELQKHKWENAFTLDLQSWGYRRNMQLDEVMSVKQLVDNVVTTVSCGGNVLINVGPTKEGTIPVIFQERLLQLGQWLKVNGESIYDTSPWLHQNDSSNGNVWYTCSKTKNDEGDPTNDPASDQASNEVIAVYAVFLVWPTNNVLKVKDVTKLDLDVYRIEILGFHGALECKIIDGEALIRLPDFEKMAVKNAWVLRFTRKEFT